MTALTGNRNLDYDPRGRNVYDLASAQQVWAGGLVGLNAAGFLIDWDNAAATQFVGVCAENALEGPTTQDVAPIHDGGGILKHIPVASAVQGSVGLEIFCTTDNVLTDCVLAAGAVSRGFGRIIRFRSNTDCDIEIYSAAEWSAGRGQLDSIASITDNSTGTGTDTIAAGVGKVVLTFPFEFITSTSAIDVATAFLPGFKFKVLDWAWIDGGTALVGASGSRVANLEIGTTDVGTSASTCTVVQSGTAPGRKIDATAISGANTGSASDTLSVEIANGGTTITAGNGYFIVVLQNMDTADAFASLRDKIEEILAI